MKVRNIVVRFNDGSLWISKGLTEKQSIEKFGEIVEEWNRHDALCLNGISSVAPEKTSDLVAVVHMYVK